MRIALIHNLLGALADMMDTKLPADESTMLNNLYKKYSLKLGGDDSVSGDDEAFAETQELDESSDEGNTETPSLADGFEYSSEDPLIRDAHSAILTMVKPTKSGIQKKLRVGSGRAKEMYESLQSDGYITEDHKTVPLGMLGKTAEVPSKKPKSKEKAEITADNFTSLIDQLPNGDDVLLSAPFNLLAALSNKRRKPYLTGLDITRYVTSDSVARAVKNGADVSLVEAIIERADKKVKAVKDPIEVNNKSAKGKKAVALISKRVAVIGELGEVLFNHMTRGGFNQTVLEDLDTIAKAVRAGDI